MLELYTITDAAKLLGLFHNQKLLYGLLAVHNIPVQKIGKAKVLDAAGLEQLKLAVEEWNNRPRLNKARETASA
jgi:hypothetical protein